MTGESPESPQPGEASIRLGCNHCDRSDYDGITEAELAGCLTEGWTDIVVFQTYEQSVTAYENPDDAPADHDVTAWYTHLGLCPDCKAETDECEGAR